MFEKQLAKRISSTVGLELPPPLRPSLGYSPLLHGPGVEFSKNGRVDVDGLVLALRQWLPEGFDPERLSMPVERRTAGTFSSRLPSGAQRHAVKPARFSGQAPCPPDQWILWPTLAFGHNDQGGLPFATYVVVKSTDPYFVTVFAACNRYGTEASYEANELGLRDRQRPFFARESAMAEDMKSIVDLMETAGLSRSWKEYDLARAILFETGRIAVR